MQPAAAKASINRCVFSAFTRKKFRLSNVFVNPALHEPFGLTLVEAAAAGVPVVATRNGGPADIVATIGHGVLIDPEDTAAISAAIRAIVGDYTQVRWGFQRNIPLEMLTAGDPDNTGRDLAGHNEVLLRSEVVIYMAIGDLSKFAKVVDAVA